MPEEKPNKDILGEEEVDKEREEREEKAESPPKSLWFWLLIAFIFLLALLPRLYVIFVLTDPHNPGANWAGDVFHRWQINYLTWKIGIHEGFRPWDLKGMEYFWGTGFTALSVGIATLTGLHDVVVSRVLTTVFGSLVVALIFVLADRFWGKKVACGAALIGMFNPVGIFMDAIGMIEPVGIFLLLLAIFFWPKKPFLTGIILGLATFMRAETWVFAMGIFLAMMLFEKDFDKRVALLISFIPINILHMKYLWDKTGNAIYSVYWNFMANAVGEWMYAPELTDIQEQIKPVFVALTVPSALGILWTFLWTLRKKIRYYSLFFLGFGNWFFITAMFGLTMYIKSYYGYTVWLTRFFTFPYLFAGLLFSIITFKIFRGRFSAFLGIALILAALLSTQVFWQPLLARYEESRIPWATAQELAWQIKKHYESGRVLIPACQPDLTYAMVRFQGFDVSQFVGDMYDPFFYSIYEDKIAHLEDLKPEIFEWLEKEDIQLMFINPLRTDYLEMIKSEPEVFEVLDDKVLGLFQIVKVNHDAFPQ